MDDTHQNADAKKPDPEAFAREYFAASEELKRRKSWGVGRKVLFGLCLVGIGICVVGMFTGRSWHRMIWVLIAFLMLPVLESLAFLLKGSTFCPRCNNDFTECAPGFCHVCGRSLEEGC